MSEAPTKVRHFATVILILNGMHYVRLADGRRAHIPAQELDGITFRPGERVALSVIQRGDHQLVAYDVESVE